MAKVHHHVMFFKCKNAKRKKSFPTANFACKHVKMFHNFTSGRIELQHVLGNSFSKPFKFLSFFYFFYSMHVIHLERSVGIVLFFYS